MSSMPATGPSRASHRGLSSARPVLLIGLVALLGSAAPAWAGELATVTAAQVSTADSVTVVALQLASSGATPTVSPFRQTGPERLVIDIAGARLADGVTGPTGGLITRSELSSFNDGQDNVRVTLYLASEATWDVKSDGGTIVLTLRPGQVEDPLGKALGQAPASTSGSVDDVRLSGPAAVPAGAALASLDFQQKERVSRVLVGVAGCEPAVTQPEKSLLAIDLPGATMPESLKRELDTGFFYSAVDSVRAYTTRAGVRVAVRLREGAEYSVKKEGELTVLEITIPSDQLSARNAALQRSASAAPSTPSTNGSGSSIGNAGGSEKLIGGDGKMIDPQGTYGNGGGASSPGSFAFATDVSKSNGGSPHYSGRRMSIDLQDADIHTVFRFIADFGEVNIVTSDDVKGTVTVRLKDVPWDEALAAILRAKGLGAQQLGRIIRVAPIETIKQEQAASLESQKSQDQLEKLQLYIAPLNYAEAGDVEGQIASVLSERGKVDVDEHGNQLIIRDRAEVIAQVRELIRSLDKPNRQVSIEARFVEANSTFTSSMGIQWGGGVDASAATGYPTGALFPNSIGIGGGYTGPSSSGTWATTTQAQGYSSSNQSLLVDLGASGTAGAISFALGSIDGLIDINARLSAVVTEGQGKIVSSPRITALDNEEAVVSQGARIPYLSTSQNGTNVQFVQATLELHVTPHITSDNTVFMDIELTNDRPDFSIQAQGQPGISTKSVQTKVLVADGDTTVLGGVYSTEETTKSTRVPGFGDIPVLGYLFKNSDKTRTQNEMLVFLTPHIVPLEGVVAAGSSN